jgi:HK97 family phage portal protein
MALRETIIRRLGGMTRSDAQSIAEAAVTKAAQYGARAQAVRFVAWGNTASPQSQNLENSLQFAWRHPYFAACLQRIGVAAMQVPVKVSRMVPDPEQADERKRAGRFVTKATCAHVQRQFARIPSATAPERARRTEWLRTKGLIEEELPEEHELVVLLDKVSPISTWPELIYQTLYDLSAAGNAYWELVGGAGGKQPTQLDRLRPDRMSVIPDPQTKVGGYKLSVNGKEIEYAVDEVIHFRVPHPMDDYYGLGSAATLDYPLQTDWARFKYVKTFFDRGTQLAALLTSDEDVMMDPDAQRRLEEEFEQEYGGVENMSKIGHLPPGVKYQELGHTPRDAEYLGMAERHDMEISAVTGVPTPLFKAKDVNRSNYEAALLQFWSDTMAPNLRFVASMMNEFLAPRYGPDLVVDFDLSVVEVLGEGMDNKVTRESQRFDAGAITLDEYRQATGDDPLEAGGNVLKRKMGDKYVVPGEPEPEPAPTPPQLRPFTGEQLPEDGENEDEAEQPEDEEAPAEVPEPPKASAPAVAKGGAARPRALEFGSAEHQKAVAAWEERLRPFERTMLEDVQAWAEDLQTQVMRKFEVGKALKATVPDVDALFDIDAEGEALWRVVEGEARRAALAEGARVLRTLGVEGATFEPESPRLLAYYADKELLVKTVATNLHEDLRSTITQGLRTGQPMERVAQRVNQRFEGLKDWQARRIAQTETVGAMNTASYSAMEQVGAEAKRWIATLDDRVRDEHALAMEEGAIPVDQRFASTGMLYPGDPAGGASQVINCRCAIASAEAEAVAALSAEGAGVGTTSSESSGTTDYGSVPDFDSSAAAQEWVQERYPTQWALSDWDTKAARRIIAQHERLATAYTDAAEQLSAVRSDAQVEERGLMARTLRFDLGRGRYHTVIEVNPQVAQEAALVDARLVTSSYTVPDTVEGVYTHEFAHVLHRVRGDKLMRVGMWYTPDNARAISTYAAASEEEFFAECVTYIHHKPVAEWPEFLHDLVKLLERTAP